MMMEIVTVVQLAHFTHTLQLLSKISQVFYFFFYSLSFGPPHPLGCQPASKTAVMTSWHCLCQGSNFWKVWILCFLQIINRRQRFCCWILFSKLKTVITRVGAFPRGTMIVLEEVILWDWKLFNYSIWQFSRNNNS